MGALKGGGVSDAGSSYGIFRAGNKLDESDLSQVVPNETGERGVA